MVRPSRSKAPDRVDRSEPVRTCIGCRTRRPIAQLVRVTRGLDGIVVDGPSSGRGAWICRTPTGLSAACVDTALARRSFDRAWRVALDAAERDAIRARTDGGPADGADRR